MGFNFGLTGIPLLILMISSVMSVGSGAALAAGGGNISICNPNSGAGQYTCTTNNNGTINFVCTQLEGGCLIQLVPECNTIIWQSPAFCTFLASGFAWFCPANSTCVSTSNTNNGSGTLSTSSINQGFGPLTGNTGYYIAIVIAIIGLSVLAGFQVLGSGVSQEGIHLLFMGGLLLGIWAIVSTAEGFLVNNPNSFFIQLNTALPYLGTGAYILLTLIFILGVTSAVSRGNTTS